MSKQISLISRQPRKWNDDRATQLAPSPSREAHHTTVEIDKHLERLSWLMDSQFRLPVLGWRFGLNTIIDLIPGVGDAATTLVALYLMVAAVRYRVPKFTLLRMGFNIAIYFLGGLIPWLGDIFDTWWKPNRRNINLLRRYATMSPQKARASDRLFVAVLAICLLALLVSATAVMILIVRAVWHSSPIQSFF